MTMSCSRNGKVFLAAAALVAIQLTTVGSASAAPASAADVTFRSVPLTAPLVAHHTVDQRAPALAQTQAATRASNSVRDVPLLRPKSAAVTGSAASGVDRAPSTTVAEMRATKAASFAGMQSSRSICPYFGTGCNPPDMALAASPDWVLQGVNSSFEVRDTQGIRQPGWPRNAQTFFGIPNEPGNCDPASGNQPFLSDPRAFYDPVDKRFWAASLQVESAFGLSPNCPFLSVYYVAVSQTADPRGTWNVYEFDMSAGQGPAADFTQVGFNDDAVYFSANMFNRGGTAYRYAELFEANKQLMEQGSGAFTASGFRSLSATGPGARSLADTVQPVLTMSSGASGEYFVDTFNGLDPVTGNSCLNKAHKCSGLALWSMQNPIAHDSGGPSPTLSASYVPTKPYVFPRPASQPSCTQCIDSSDLRIGGTPVFRDGTVYAAWETAINNGTQVVPGIEYAQVNAATPAESTSSYYFSDADNAVTYPVVMPDGAGRVVMLYDRMGSTVNPQTRFITTSTAAGSFTGAGHLLKAGEASYRPGVCGTAVLPVCRWGDFSAASSDSTGSVWVAGQYANANVGPSTDPDFSSRNWGTWISNIVH